MRSQGKDRSQFIITLIFIISFLMIPHTYSQEYKCKPEKLTINNDLFSNQIQCVIKDKKGFIWFGTKYGGLYRYDGYHFKSFKPLSTDPESISDFCVMSLCDDDDYLWIGTNKGLNRFNKHTEKFKTYGLNIDDAENKNSCLVWTIIISKKKEIWFGMGRSLCKIDSASDLIARYKTYPKISIDNDYSDFVRTLCEDKDGLLWIGTYGGGLDSYDPVHEKFSDYSYDPSDPFSLSDDRISKLLEDINGNIWVATSGGGINKFEKESGKFYRYQNDPAIENSLVGNNVSTMSIDEDQVMWIGTSEGISLFDIKMENFTNLKRTNDPASLSKITCIYPDNEGIIWICTASEGGFSICDKNKWKFNHYRNIPGKSEVLSSNEIASVCEDSSGNLWIGTKNGIDVLSNNKERIRHIESNSVDAFSLNDNNISCIYCDSKNFVWVGTTEGPLERYDPLNDKFTHFYYFNEKSLAVSCIFEDRNGNLWVGLSKGGIRVFDNRMNPLRKYLTLETGLEDVNEIQIYSIFEDSKGHIFAGTNQGLITIDSRTEIISIKKNDPDDRNTISSNIVYSVAEDKHGYLWFGASRGGLNRFDPITKSYKAFVKGGNEGFCSVSGLLQDNTGNFWCITEKNIVMFNINSESFTCYGIADGIQGLEFKMNCYYRAKDGELFFGGSNGFNSFYPDSVFHNKNVPVIVLTDFMILNREVKLDTSITEIKEITATHVQNFVSFNYAALDYTDPAKNQYAYMMEGVDKDWINAGNIKSVNYTDLHPGEYVFRVKGSNNDGLWSTTDAVVRLTITPAWYSSIWLKGFAVFFLFGGIEFIYLQRIRKLKRAKKFQEQFTKKLIESQENERKRLAGELHDSLGQSLMVIKNKLNFVKDHKEECSVLKELDAVSDLTSNAIEEVRAISHNLRPYELERLGLTEAILSVIENINASMSMNVMLEIENIDNLLSPEFEIHYYRIVQECMTNILKHSEAKSASIEIKKTVASIETTIIDNGIGFDEGNVRRLTEGIGLAGIQERVNLMNGRVEIESVPDKGTLYLIIIPVRQ